MSTPPSHSRSTSVNTDYNDVNSGTFAAFSPASNLHTTLAPGSHRSTILIHQKSPLLVATPPQITRALAYSHPFLRPLNKFVGLLSWTTDDSWESFILVASFWATVLYGDFIIRWAGPLFVVLSLILAMYARRWSLLSSTGWTGEKRKKAHKRSKSELHTSEHSSLEDIVETLRLFTSRCNILLDPFLRLTDFLSTQTSATSATTKPALTALFIRIVLVTPAWIILTLPPFRLITTKRVVLAVGTTILTWHSQPARVTRTIFWRSRSVRQICSLITGLNLLDPAKTHSRHGSAHRAQAKSPHEIAASLAAKSGRDSPSLRFTFSLYENQRRWLGIGWTSSLLAYERAPWSDEHLNSSPSKDKFVPPEVEGGLTKWQWVEDSEWHVVDTDGDTVENPNDASSDGGWIYYDNKVCSPAFRGL
jgi:Integral peroxisomal membrane peroxin